MDVHEEVVVTETATGPRVDVSWRRALELQSWVKARGIGSILYAEPRTRKARLLLRTNLSALRARELLLQAPR